MSELSAPPLTPEEVAERWKTTPLRVLKLCKTRRLRHFKIGKGVCRIPVDAVPEFEAKCITPVASSEDAPSRPAEKPLTIDDYIPKIIKMR